MVNVAEQLRAGPVLSEASIFERLRRTPGIEFDAEVGIGALVTDNQGHAALWETHREYLAIGRDAGLPVLLQTDTWRAHPERIARSNYARRDLNTENARMLRDLRQAEAQPGDVIILDNLSVHKSPKAAQILKDIGGGDGPAVEPSLVDAALICKEFLNLGHVIECGLLSGLRVRPDRCRWPRW